jgi:hypothetical protein
MASLAKTTRGSAQAGYGLREESPTEFLQVPLPHCVEFLQDMHDLPFQLLAGFDKEVTMSASSAPLHQVLTSITEAAGLDWHPLRDVLVVGTEEHIQTVASLGMKRARRWSQIALADAPVPRALRESASLSVHNVPLSTIAASLGERHDVEIQVAPDHAQNTLSIEIRSVPLEDLLELVCLKAQIPWSADAQKIYLGRASN